MKTKTVETFKFSELPENIQDRIIEKEYEYALFDDWADPVLDYEKEKLEGLGFYDVVIHYSGFGSQGDGAAFDSKIYNHELMLLMEKLGLSKDQKYHTLYLAMWRGDIDVNMVTENSWRGYFTNVHIDFDIVSDISDHRLKVIRKQFENFANYIIQWVSEISQDIYYALRNEYEYLTSREMIIENIEAMDCDYDEHGRII